MSESAASTRVPTERQYQLLLSIGSGAAALSRTKRDTEPLLRHGWVTADWRPPYYQFVRITAAGLHALARAVERFGLPSMEVGHYHEKVCSECGRKWKPKCRCGSSSYRYEAREVERAAA